MNNLVYGITFSLLLHYAIFNIDMPTIKKAECNVQFSKSSVEVSLISLKKKEVIKNKKEKSQVERKVKITKVKPTIKKQIKIKNKKTNKLLKKINKDKSQKVKRDDKNSVANTQTGAIVQAKPIKRVSPAPIYPRIARDRGYEGKVILLVGVDSEGKVFEVNIKKSSAYSILDKAAIKAIKHWRFNPARKGHLKIKSKVEIPIVFKLNN